MFFSRRPARICRLAMKTSSGSSQTALPHKNRTSLGSACPAQIPGFQTWVFAQLGLSSIATAVKFQTFFNFDVCLASLDSLEVTPHGWRKLHMQMQTGCRPSHLTEGNAMSAVANETFAERNHHHLRRTLEALNAALAAVLCVSVM